MSNSKNFHCARTLTIIKVTGKEGETIQMSDSVMDFSPEELNVIINMLAIMVNHAVIQRKCILQALDEPFVKL